MTNYSLLVKTARIILNTVSDDTKAVHMLQELLDEKETFEPVLENLTGEFMNKPEESKSFLQECKDLGLCTEASESSTLRKNRMTLFVELTKRCGSTSNATELSNKLKKHEIYTIEDLCYWYDDPTNWNTQIVGPSDLTILHGIYLSANEECGVTAEARLAQYLSSCLPSRKGYNVRAMNLMDSLGIYTIAQLRYKVAHWQQPFAGGKKRTIDANARAAIIDKVQSEPGYRREYREHNVKEDCVL